MQTDFDAMGGTYTQVGDYLLPDVEAPESPQIGIWGERRRKYLQEHEKTTYTAMLLADTLNAHLEEVDKSASIMFEQLVAQYKEQEGIHIYAPIKHLVFCHTFAILSCLLYNEARN